MEEGRMKLEWLEKDFSVGKWQADAEIAMSGNPFWFLSRTDKELSLFCPTEEMLENAKEYEHGWVGFRVAGELEFSLVGVLSQIANALAYGKISIFAISTFDTDYVFMKKEKKQEAQDLLQLLGWNFMGNKA